MAFPDRRTADVLLTILGGYKSRSQLRFSCGLTETERIRHRAANGY